MMKNASTRYAMHHSSTLWKDLLRERERRTSTTLYDNNILTLDSAELYGIGKQSHLLPKKTRSQPKPRGVIKSMIDQLHQCNHHHPRVGPFLLLLLSLFHHGHLERTPGEFLLSTRDTSTQSMGKTKLLLSKNHSTIL